MYEKKIFSVAFSKNLCLFDYQENFHNKQVDISQQIDQIRFEENYFTIYQPNCPVSLNLVNFHFYCLLQTSGIQTHNSYP